MDKLSIKELGLLEQYIEEMPESIVDQYVYWKWYYNIWWWSDYFLIEWKKKWDEFIESPEFHEQIWSMLTDEEMYDINVIVARWHGKTTALLIYIMWRIIYFPKWSLVYVANKNLWEKWLGKIRRELETNEKINHIYWNIVPANSDDPKDKKLNKWRQRELEFTNGSYIETVTKWWSVRWARPREIIIDDPQENIDVTTPAKTNKYNEWAFTSLYNVLLPGGRMVALWTIVGNLCFVKHLRDEKWWPTVEYQACDENYNNILWPDMWDKKSLIERRDGKIYLDPLTWKTKRKKWIWTPFFNQEFRNIPLNTADKTIKEEWIRYYIAWIQFDYIIFAIDPATKTKEKSDFTWLCVLWVKDYKKYVIYSKWVKLSPRNLEQFIINLNDKFEPDIIVKEDNIEVKLTDDLKARWLPIEGVWAHKDKHTRLLGIAGMIEVWDVYFLKNKQDELIEQLTQYPDVEHDDEMDALVYALIKSQEYLDGEEWGEVDVI